MYGVVQSINTDASALRLAPVSGNQVDFALQLGNDDILIQYDALAAHGFS